MQLTVKLSKLSIVVICVLIALLSTVYYFRLDALAWYAYHNLKPTNHENAFQLGRYQVAIDGKPLAALKNASGLTHNAERNTLLTVLNQESKIIELDVEGNILREVDVAGVDDMEGITHVSGNRYVISDERDNRLVLVELDDDATAIDVSESPKLKLGINPVGNKNFEGVSWDDNNRRLLVVKERDPKYIMSVQAFLMPIYQNL